MTSLVNIDDIDLFDADLFVGERFHEPLRILRNEDPVHWHEPKGDAGGFWSLTKYDDVLAVSRNPELFISSKGIIGPPVRPEAMARLMQERPSEAMQAGGGFSNVLI